MNETPKGLRLHIGLYGRRNVGKSSLLNALTGQQVAIVSQTPGTTTDPVEKTLELAPLGPVVFIDTAGIDDEGALGEQRKERALKVLDRTDIALLVAGPEAWGEYEAGLAALMGERKIPFAVVFNKDDLSAPPPDALAALENAGIRTVSASAALGRGLGRIKEVLAELTPEDWFAEPRLLGDLLPAGELAVLVVPIDLGAPKGRLILPQVQSIRDILDSDASCMVVKERELRDALARLNRKPRIVICDSQVVLKTAGDTPPDVLLTTFSILMARFKGDLVSLARGVAAIEALRPGDKVLIAEACTHHPLADDIGRVKIPRWLRQYAGGDLQITNQAGKDFPEDLTPYALVVHCAACVANRRQMLTRIYRAQSQGVPMTNYGLAISYVQGVLPRVLDPFPAARAAYCEARAQAMGKAAPGC
ncbi:iron-only hydrogenase maturation protein HydF [Humidesulfovibrio mexicanus]|uniref:Iron-only hydrogenase maturation protein HydF n=1 Tax=Humidesulfovibrio mexicanus TaxID=147047 RepID=A0A239AAB8_9BACT|nr:[FeFe] hydrogenase H-cluster maturation GTPase HydF [Humidesulfovibrio mexicanus]SNR92530.1 iron-only hydrogenase maturation protein HydF [Humidesulfovibrio mexicanus]